MLGNNLGLKFDGSGRVGATFAWPIEWEILYIENATY